MERELIEFQTKMADPELEKKLRKQAKKYKALWEDSQSELERLKDSRGNSAIVKSLRNQLDDLQASEATANKSLKRLQGEMDEMIIQNDELSRSKIDVSQVALIKVDDRGSCTLVAEGGGREGAYMSCGAYDNFITQSYKSQTVSNFTTIDLLQ